MNNIPEPLKSILNDYCHVEWSEEMNELSSDISRDDWAYNAVQFKAQLRRSITNPFFSLDEYEKVTGEDFDDQEELISRLKEIWSIAFVDEEII